MMGLRSSTPRIFTILGKMARQMTTLTFVFVWAVSSLVGSLADGTLEGLARVPDTAWITLDVAMKRNTMFQGHVNNAGACRNLLETGKMLMTDVEDFGKGGKRQESPGVTSFRQQRVDIGRSYR